VTGKRRLRDEGGIALKSDKYDEGLLRCLFIILAIFVDWSRGNTEGSNVENYLRIIATGEEYLT